MFFKSSTKKKKKICSSDISTKTSLLLRQIQFSYLMLACVQTKKSLKWYSGSIYNNISNTCEVTLDKKCSYFEFFWFVFSRIQSECGKMRSRKAPNTDTFPAVLISVITVVFTEVLLEILSLIIELIHSAKV